MRGEILKNEGGFTSNSGFVTLDQILKVLGKPPRYLNNKDT